MAAQKELLASLRLEREARHGQPVREQTAPVPAQAPVRRQAFLATAVQLGYLSDDEKQQLLLAHGADDAAALAGALAGCPIVIHGLNSAPELNGTHGEVIGGPMAESGRYEVAIAPPREPFELTLRKSLKLANLAPPAPVDGPILFTLSDKDDAAAAGIFAPAVVAAQPSESDTCRICLSGVDEVTLIQPCACRGSLRYACSDCVVRAAVAAWEGGAQNEMRCKSCMQEYDSGINVAIAQAVIERCAAKAAAATDEAEGRQWKHLGKERERHSVADLVEHGRQLGNGSDEGRAMLLEAEVPAPFRCLLLPF